MEISSFPVIFGILFQKGVWFPFCPLDFLYFSKIELWAINQTEPSNPPTDDTNDADNGVDTGEVPSNAPTDETHDVDNGAENGDTPSNALTDETDTQVDNEFLCNSYL